MKANQNMLLREIAGETVLVPVGEAALKIHGMIVLNESGAVLWKALQQDCTRDELIQAILGEYEVDAETAAKDVDDFLAQMEQVGILEHC